MSVNHAWWVTPYTRAIIKTPYEHEQVSRGILIVWNMELETIRMIQESSEYSKNLRHLKPIIIFHTINVK